MVASGVTVLFANYSLFHVFRTFSRFFGIPVPCNPAEVCFADTDAISCDMTVTALIAADAALMV